MADEPNAQAAEAQAATAAEKTLLDQILEEGRMLRASDAENDEKRNKAKDLLGEYVERIHKEFEASDKAVQSDTISAIEGWIADIDAQLSEQMNEILHHAEFQEMEARWRGLHYLVYNTETSKRLKLRLMCATKMELKKDLENAPEFDQSQLFKKVYEEEYGTFGGNPYGMLVGDYYFAPSPWEVKMLQGISGVASAAHAPFIAAASPGLFDMDSFTQLSDPRDLEKGFESSDYADWRSFRRSDDSRYVTLTLPRMLLRLPYGEKTQPIEEFKLEEEVTGPQHDRYLWGNSAYGLAARITDAFAKHSWCAAIRGVEGGGLVEGLPAHSFATEEGEKALKTPTEIAITDRREKELDNLGFISLCHHKGENFACFFGGQTTHEPDVEFDTDLARANARIAARLPYVLAASRFAHYLKVICRDKIGSFQSKASISLYLNRWIQQYVLATDDAGQSLKAKYPLREARIDVTEVAENPGAYRAVVFLRPHFQLEELTASLRMVAELPPPAAA